MKRILLLHTGGTISMSTDQTTGDVRPSSENPLHHYRHLFGEAVHVKAEDLFQLPSPHITLKEMTAMKERIERAVEADEADGIVLTHGTDTLEETAYFLDLTLHASIPVVLTGAMRPADSIGADGLLNLQAAVWTAMSEEAADKGVLVVMNEEIHAARHVTKTHTTNVATFRTPTFGPIGILAKNHVHFFQKLVEREHFPVDTIRHTVPLLKAYAGMESQLLEAVFQMKPDGLVIEALGAGNLPPAVLPSLKKFLENDLPVVLVSRAFNGIAQDIYDYEGGGRQLKQAGVIFAPGLSGPKARIKLLILLEQTKDPKEMANCFE
ncbi:asparaginase [Atopococcus tabaci]|uniref:asparaginase n=1 Tax=Atopococcus tabaci TaxID=269774 RepID=UPI00041C7CFA|nr:asparaginase [Atopococcus tabaci]